MRTTLQGEQGISSSCPHARWLYTRSTTTTGKPACRNEAAVVPEPPTRLRRRQRQAMATAAAINPTPPGPPDRILPEQWRLLVLRRGGWSGRFGLGGGHSNASPVGRPLAFSPKCSASKGDGSNRLLWKICGEEGGFKEVALDASFQSQSVLRRLLKQLTRAYGSVSQPAITEAEPSMHSASRPLAPPPPTFPCAHVKFLGVVWHEIETLGRGLCVPGDSLAFRGSSPAMQAMIAPALMRTPEAMHWGQGRLEHRPWLCLHPLNTLYKAK